MKIPTQKLILITLMMLMIMTIMNGFFTLAYEWSQPNRNQYRNRYFPESIFEHYSHDSQGGFNLIPESILIVPPLGRIFAISTTSSNILKFNNNNIKNHDDGNNEKKMKDIGRDYKSHLVEFNQKEQWKILLEIPNNLEMKLSIPAEMDNLGFYYTVMRNLTSGNDLIMKFHVEGSSSSKSSFQIIANSTLMPSIDSIICVDPHDKMFVLSNGKLINYNVMKSHLIWVSSLTGISKSSQMLYDEDLLFVSFSGGIARINIGSGHVVGQTEINQYVVELNPSILSFDERYIVGFEKKVQTSNAYWLHIVDQKFITKGSLSSDLLKDRNGKVIDLSRCSNVMSQVDSILFFCHVSNSTNEYSMYKFDISEDSLRATLGYQVEFQAKSCSKQLARFDHYSYFATVCDSHIYVFSMNSPQIVRKPLNIRTNENTQIVGSTVTFFVLTTEVDTVNVEVVHAKV
ncbi:predicted protein [Naegleria gruberi]|uniref:Predicted protein n=1 Tax=Naegleria gruberi TaxID=5762 RepID=D2UZE5_NAEGR|nr:uncharacterized protein NAEGRDRAFT_61908 [Naegleria gruberi]EFC49935.1 predicted protein [Naegleria gruberi]|eukprot:XP_002682679.1 predicted protein [Naegleria gruberi strain NEG-M]